MSNWGLKLEKIFLENITWGEKEKTVYLSRIGPKIEKLIAQELKKEREEIATRLRVIRANIPVTFGKGARRQLKKLIEELS